MSKLGFAVVWIALCSGTILVRTLSSSKRPTAASSQLSDSSFVQFESALDRVTQIEFDTMSRRYHPAGSDQLETLSQYVRDHSSGLLRCRDLVNSPRRELYEFSYDIDDLDGKSSLDVKLRDVKLEKSTASLNPSQEQCLIDEFSKLQPPRGSGTSGRGFFTLCVRPRVVPVAAQAVLEQRIRASP